MRLCIDIAWKKNEIIQIKNTINILSAEDVVILHLSARKVKKNLFKLTRKRTIRIHVFDYENAIHTSIRWDEVEELKKVFQEINLNLNFNSNSNFNI